MAEQSTQQDIATAFVDWTNTLNLQRTITTFNDININVLIDIAVSLDPAWFKHLSRSDDNNKPMLKFTKVKRLYTFLTRYYEELGHSTSSIDSPNLNAIAKDDVNETMKLCSLIVTLAVTYPQNAKYIEKIQGLSPKSQQGLMLSIEGVMKQLGESTIEAAPSKKPTVNLDNEIKQIMADNDKLMADKEALERAYKATIAELENLTNQRDELRAETEELNQKLKDMEAALDQSTRTGKADFILKSEIDRLQNELRRYDNQREESLTKLNEKDTKISELTRKVEQLNEQANEAARLKDQLDEYRHDAEKLKKAENVIEKYKKKLEEGVDLRRALKNLEQENRSLIDHNRSIQEEYNKISNFKVLIEDYRRQVDELNTEKAELVSQKSKFEYEYRHMRSRIEAYEMASTRDQENIHLLEDRLRELEMGEGEPLKLDDKAEQDEIDQSIDDSELSDALKGTTKTTLRLRINDLERELNTLREGKHPSENADAEILVLRHKLDDANRLKDKFQEECTRVRKDLLLSESENERLRGGSSNGVNEPRKNIEKGQKELLETRRQLKEVQEKLEQTEREIGENRPDSNTEARIKALEDENKDLKSRNEELIALLQNFEGKSEDDLRSQNIQLYRQASERAKKIDHLKAFSASQHEIIENYKNAATSFEAEREAHAAEVKRLEKLLKESKEQLQKEINLVTSAWFNMGRRIQGDHVFLQRKEPVAFLNLHRSQLKNQLSR